MIVQHQPQSRRTYYAVALTGIGMLALAGCAREQQQLQGSPHTQASMSTTQPESARTQPKMVNPYEGNLAALDEGKRLYNQFNCVGCHAAGGGAIGPALMDNKWLYGSDPANIYSTIVEGRPRGMPSFRDKIPEDDIWKIVAYVRTLSGLGTKPASGASLPPKEQASGNQK